MFMWPLDLHRALPGALSHVWMSAAKVIQVCAKLDFLRVATGWLSGFGGIYRTPHPQTLL